MRRHDRVLGLCLLLAVLLIGALPARTTYASAKTAAWATLVNYRNSGTKPAKLLIKFFPEQTSSQGGTAYRPPVDLPVNGSIQLPVGTIVSGGRRGNIVITSDQPLASTVTQYALDSSIRSRPMFPGFRTADTSDEYLIATVLGQMFDTTTVVSIQNVEPFDIDATIRFYNATDGALAATKVVRIPATSSKYIDMALTSDTGLPSSTFNGSARITATYAGNAAIRARIVAAAVEYSTNGTFAAAFEGIPPSKTGTLVYMPTALCQKFGADTFYAVQNASNTSGTDITVTYRNIDGSIKTTDGPYRIGPGQKKSLNTCFPSTGVNMANFSGSATISSSSSAIIALGKARTSAAAPVQGSLNQYMIFYGETRGYSKLALPLVRWANDSEYFSSTGDKQRTSIAVQNVQNTPITVNVRYWDKAGTLRATHRLTIAAMTKGNSDPTLAGALDSSGRFGYYSDGSAGGSVTIEADSANLSAKFIAIARLFHPDHAEDYNGIPIDG